MSIFFDFDSSIKIKNSQMTFFHLQKFLLTQNLNFDRFFLRTWLIEVKIWRKKIQEIVLIDKK